MMYRPTHITLTLDVVRAMAIRAMQNELNLIFFFGMVAYIEIFEIVKFMFRGEVVKNSIFSSRW
jgi:hypothetical protein